jgi:hypothetical protein
MDYERMGILVTMIVLVGVLGVAVVASGEFDIGTKEIKLPQITSSTDTSHDGFYDYCYRMGFEC